MNNANTPISNTQCITNKIYDEIKIGDKASITRTLTKQDIQLFAIVTGDMNPAHLDEAYAKTDIFRRIVGHGMWTGSLFSTLLGMYLPGPGTIYLNQTLKFICPVGLGETIHATIEAIAKDKKQQHITFATICINEKGEKVLEGEAVVIAPKEKICWNAGPIPEVVIKSDSNKYESWLLNQIKNLKPLKTAVVHPMDVLSLSGAVAAAHANIIEPIFVGNIDKIKKIAKDSGIDLGTFSIVNTEHSHESAAKAVQMVAKGEVEALMKGHIATEELLEAVIDRDAGLRTGRRLSHIFVLDVPSYPKPLFLTDAVVNIRPSLMEKKDIVQNAIDLFQTLKLGIPKVAILSAVEMVNEKMPSTLDAAALCKMSQRGQIKGGILDGPLAFDNAVSRESLNIKGINSAVGGDADILVVPDLEAGNMLYKQLRYFSGVQGAGIVLGAKVPIILTSRSGDTENRVISSALAQLYVRSKIN